MNLLKFGSHVEAYHLATCGIGLVLVVSPLIALMDNQVAAAREICLSAGALHLGSPDSVRGGRTPS